MRYEPLTPEEVVRRTPYLLSLRRRYEHICDQLEWEPPLLDTRLLKRCRNIAYADLRAAEYEHRFGGGASA